MNYYIQKAAGLLVTLLLVSFITFSVFQILPGNPAYIILGVDADPMQIAALNKSMGLDKPALVRYVDWIAGLFQRRSSSFISLPAAGCTAYIRCA